MSRVPSNSSYINQVSHTGKNVLKAVQQANEKTLLKVSSRSAQNENSGGIYSISH
jgi:hypothetical protein